MGIALIDVDARRVRALIARLWLRDADMPERLGGVALRPHQRDAAVRLRHAFAEFGGAMLADEAGLGKTYTALAAARHARSLLVVGPASLLPMWRDALRAADAVATLISFERLSRGSSVELDADLVIVDEAHHARNSTTRRYHALAELATNATVLLLSATPIHNHPGELVALLALFLGERAATLDAAARSRCIVRRSHSEPADLPQLPGISLPRWLPLSHDDAIPRALLAMPPPCPPRDGGAADSLVLLSLLRAWGSSDGALRQALRRRIGRAESLIAALEAGRHPSRAELRAWTEGDDAVQLAFPELVAAEPPAVDGCALREALRAHADGARDVIRALGPDDARDAERVARLLELRAEVGHARIVAFTQFADTVTSLFRGLRRSPAVAALTARGAEVAGGRLGRLDALRRFAPRASGAADPGPAERITMLLTTDVSSEGVNLQDASVVVHLDLPWTAARLEQRVGRVRRMGSTHETVRVYAMAPPASADALLGVRRILDRKAGDARRLVGAMPLLIPGGDVANPPSGPAQVVEQLRRAVRAWSVAEYCDAPPAGGASLVAGVRADRSGMIALCLDRGLPVLVATTGTGPLSTDPEMLLEAIASASGATLELADCCRSSAMARLGRWLSERRGRHAVSGTVAGGIASPRARLLRRIARIVADAPAHRRPVVVTVAAAARAAVERAQGAGVEKQLHALGDLDEPDDVWLRRCAAQRWRRGGTTGVNRDDCDDLRVICVLLMQPDGSRS